MTGTRSESDTTGLPTGFPHPMPAFETHPEEGAFRRALRRAAYWRAGAIALGVGLVLSIGAYSGPSSATAGEQSGGRFDQMLSIGGFDAVEGEAVFVIVGSDGERIGVLPMAGRSEAIDSQDSAD